MSGLETLKREVRVALSRQAQPIWFRALKWMVILAASAVLWRTPYFWWWVCGGLALGLALHLFWRWKTGGWTRPWGGWRRQEEVRQKVDFPGAVPQARHPNDRGAQQRM